MTTTTSNTRTIYKDKYVHLFERDLSILFFLNGRVTYQGMDSCPTSSMKNTIRAWRKFRAENDVVYHCLPHTSDGYGEHRIKVYTSFGFVLNGGMMYSFPNSYTDEMKEEFLAPAKYTPAAYDEEPPHRMWLKLFTALAVGAAVGAVVSFGLFGRTPQVQPQTPQVENYDFM